MSSSTYHETSPAEESHRHTIHADRSHTNQAGSTGLKEVANRFRLLADETRLRVLSLLIEFDELNVRSLCELLGHSQPSVSHHLGLLRAAGLVRVRRDGKHNYYRTIPENLESLIELARENVTAPRAIDKIA